MKIRITEFAERHFDPKFGGTKILDISKDAFEEIIDKDLSWIDFNECEKGMYLSSHPEIIVHDGYAPFCKLVAIKNFTDARVGSMPITLENYQFIRSGYSARRDSELPIFSRWLELPLGKPKAEWLVLVLYNNEQLKKEHFGQSRDPHDDNPGQWIYADDDWGIVAILGQSHPNEEPMKPETMIRNALGIEEGGSGVPLDKEKYLESVEFWSKNITVK